MREGRAPLLETVRQAHPPYLMARKGLERKNSEVREQLGMLNATFTASIKKLRESAKNTDDSGEAVLLLYAEMSKQATAVAAFIDKELSGFQKLFKPVSEKFAGYQGAVEAYNAYMATWFGKLPEADLSGQAFELVKQDIEKSLRVICIRLTTVAFVYYV